MAGPYSRLFEFTRDGIYSYTFADGKILSANHGFIRILDLDCKPPEVEGRLLKDVMTYVEKEGTVRRLLEEKGELHNYEYHFKTLKGEDRWVIYDSFLSVDPVTGERVVETIVKDITDRKKKEDEARRYRAHLEELVKERIEELKALNEQLRREVAERKEAEERLAKINSCFLKFGSDSLENIKLLTALLGETMGATCALYNRLEEGMLCSIGQWNTPSDYNAIDKPEGHLCYDVIRHGTDIPFIVNNLPGTPYAATDSNVARYNLRTYVGVAVKSGGRYIGSLCAVYQKDVILTEDDKKLIGLIATAVGIEEERLRMEGDILESKEYLSKIINSIGDPVFVKDRQHRLILVNDAECRLAGHLREDVTGKTDYDFFPKEQVDIFWKKDEMVFETGEENINEETITDAQGVTHTIITKKTRYIDPEGNKFIVGIIRDITDRKATEEQLQQNYDIQKAVNSLLNLSLRDMPLEEFLKNTLDLIMSIPRLSLESRGGIFLTEDHSDTLRLKVHNGLTEQIQKACGSVPFGKCLCGKAALTKKTQFAASIDERHETTYEGIIPHGHYCVPVLWADKVLGVINFYLKEGHPYKKSEEDFLVAVANTLAGVIERKRVEEELKKSEASLAEAQRIARLGNWEWDIKANSIKWSAEVYRIFGRAPSDFNGTLEAFLEYIHPADRGFVKEALDDALHKQENYSIDHSILLPNAVERIVHEQGEITYDGNGEPVRMVGTVNDITERKIMEGELRKHRDHLEDLVKQRAAQIIEVNESLQREVAERKRVEEALRESGENYKTLFEHSPIALFQEDCSGMKKYIDSLKATSGADLKKYFEDHPEVLKECIEAIKIADANKQALMLFDARDKEELYRAVKNILIADAYSDFAEAIVASSEGKYALEHETSIHTLTGAKKYCTVKISTVAGSETTWAKVLISMVDITERKLVEEALEISEANYRAIFDTANDAIFVFDIKTGVIIDANRKGCEMYCYSRDEIRSLGIDMLSSGEHIYTKDGADSWIQRASNGEPQIVEWLSKDKAGRLFWVEINLRRAIVGSKYCLLAVVRDITERKESEEKLRESDLRFRKAVFDATFPIMIHSEDGDVMLLNKAWTELSGYTQEDIPTTSVWAEKAYGSKKAIVKADIDKLYKLDERVKEGEYVITAKTGEKRVWDFSAAPLGALPNGKRIVMSMAMDITERKGAENQIKELNRELLKTNNMLKQLALKDSHTGLYGHRYLAEAILKEFSRAKREATPLSVIMLDIDYFKSINDVYGHQFGDIVLKQFAAHLKKAVRIYDIVIRYGGEEFIIISPGSDRAGALVLARRILNTVSLARFGDKEHSVKMKMSAGAVSYPEDRAVKAMDLVNFVDKILNKAKEEGGNRVCSSVDMKRPKASVTMEEEEDITDVKLLKEKIEKLTKRGNQSLIEAIFAFAKTIEVKDNYTGEHVEKAVHYATEIAKELNLSKNEIELIKKAAALHDLGKVGISDKILRKKSKLTEKEFEEIKRHSQIGVDILRPVHFMHDIIPLILHHHERWDGKGYPDKLRGDEIPIGARIISVSDAYDALTSNRPYRKAYRKNKAIEIIKRASGTMYDPRIINAFFKVLKDGK
jgi:diguanylate cyclase (GGDEF)-like protein/PAS domain S-box-containing protein